MKTAIVVTLSLALAAPLSATPQAQSDKASGLVENGFRLNGIVINGTFFNGMRFNGSELQGRPPTETDDQVVNPFLGLDQKPLGQ